MKRIDPPLHKKDWPGCALLLRERTHKGFRGVVRVVRRRSAADPMPIGHEYAGRYNERVLEVCEQCPCCDHTHTVMIPESWLDQGKAVFVTLDETDTTELAFDGGPQPKDAA